MEDNSGQLSICRFSDPLRTRLRRGFTLLELLVVIAIIGVLASITFPAMKNLTKANQLDDGVRQLLDDLTYARQKAISEQTTVYFVFAPTDMSMVNYATTTDRDERGVILNATLVTNLMDGSYRAYCYYTERSVGDQPGTGVDSYELPWQKLPDGTIVAMREFDAMDQTTWEGTDSDARPLAVGTFPFPTQHGELHDLPFLAFDFQGSLVNPFTREKLLHGDEIIEVVRASVLAPRLPDGTVDFDNYDVRETAVDPGGQNRAYIRIDAFSGEASIVRGN